MGKSLIIVESPAKAKTIEKLLGKDFSVLASFGHIRSLPRKSNSVDVNNNFCPKFEIIPEKKKRIQEIKKRIKGCEKIYLATDMDREGEAIAWHLVEVLKLNKNGVPYSRITFHEVTKDAILEALKNPRPISKELVDAQKARVILDYLFGFNLSPFLWRKVRSGLSAGRVQSVALRLICEREKEIKSFKPKEYWTIVGEFSKRDGQTFKADLVFVDGKKIKKGSLSEKETEDIVKRAKKGKYTVLEINRKERRTKPHPPFITSTLQQEAFNVLGFRASKTMSIAQKLYEGVEIGDETKGLITYMRTDSVYLSDKALFSIREFIKKNFGKEYLPERPTRFQTKVKNAQEAHEAIRVTDINLTPKEVKKYLSTDEFKLYELIWKRSCACQMNPSIHTTVTFKIGSDNGLIFQVQKTNVEFDGYLKIYPEKRKEDSRDFTLEEGETLKLINIEKLQHFTQPPPRYTEASLVKTLEEYGIGRPSTYAQIIDTLIARGYVKFLDGKFYPEELGEIVNELLCNHFKEYVDYNFTARMEENLDLIAKGNVEWLPVVKDFFFPFRSLIEEKEKTLKRSDILTQKTDEICPVCGKPLLIRFGKYGRFYACSGFPECKYTKPIEDVEETDYKCPNCKSNMVIKKNRFGARFLACKNYPNCKTVMPYPLGISCPNDGCDGEIVEKSTRKGKIFWGCNKYPDCNVVFWQRPVNVVCPKCGHQFLLEKKVRKNIVYVCPKCDFMGDEIEND